MSAPGDRMLDVDVDVERESGTHLDCAPPLGSGLGFRVRTPGKGGARYFARLIDAREYAGATGGTVSARRVDKANRWAEVSS